MPPLLRPVLLGITYLCLASPGAAVAQDDGRTALWGSVEVPGGAAAAREAVGLGSADGRLDALLLLDFARRYADSGADTAVSRLDTHLRAAASTGDPAAGAASLPLPLPEFWNRDVFSSERLPLTAIFQRRSTLLTYHGLMALDDDTLAALAPRRELLRWLASTTPASAAFATAARSIRIANGAVQTPGGIADAIWTQLVGRPTTEIDSFLRDLLTKDRGRLAYFYDTVASLPADRQRFVLGAHLTPDEQRSFVRAIYRAFVTIDPTWRVEIRPFYRPDFDGLVALLALDVRPDGTVGPDWWPAVLARVTRTQDWPAGPDATPGDLRAQPADARWLFEWVFAASDARDRFALLRFAQRVFASAPREAAPAMETALRGLRDMPALLLGLERMGVRDVALLATLARAAHDSASAGGASAEATGRWQAALALLEQAQRRLAWPTERLEPLLRSWALAAPSRSGSRASVHAWIATTLVPALVGSDVAADALEDTFIREATRVPDRPPLHWEGLTYALRPGDVSARSAIAMRQSQDGPRLEHLVLWQSAYIGLESGPRTETEHRDANGQLRSLERAISAMPGTGGLSRDLLRDVSRALDDLSARRGFEPGRPVAVDRVIADFGDAIADAVVPPLIYALAVAPTSEPRLYSELWMRHVLRIQRRADEGGNLPWSTAVWQLPRNAGDVAGVRLVGSFLGVDVALASSQLMRVVFGLPPVPQILDEIDRGAIVESLVAPAAPVDAATIAGAIEALAEARRMLLAWRESAPARAELAAALRRSGVDGWRANAIAWAAGTGDATALDHLSVSDAYWLKTTSRETPAAWSASSRPIDGCLCRMDGRRVPPELLRGRRVGVQAFGPLDAALRVVELLDAMGIDTAITDALLPMALQDWLDRSDATWIDDVDAFAIWPPTLTAGRVEEYLMELVATGRLSAPDSSDEGRP